MKEINLKEIYKELKAIEEFESNFNPTPRSKFRRLYLLSILS